MLFAVHVKMFKSVTLRSLIKHLENTFVNSKASVGIHHELACIGSNKVLLVSVVTGPQAWLFNRMIGL